MRLFLCGMLILLALVAAPGTQAAPPERPNLPKSLEKSLDALLAATRPGSSNPTDFDVNMVLRFVTGTDGKDRLKPASRERATGIFRHASIRLPLREMAAYFLTPGVPSEAIYPATVRHNQWIGEVENAEALLEAQQKGPWPPSPMRVARGQAREQTTPDPTSGCYFAYDLHRLFILTRVGGQAAFISVSRLPQPSETGRKGHMIGKDNDWRYVYLQKKGTTLPMLGWAETQLYHSSTITLFVESRRDSAQTDVYLFKWASAGWSGMDVIKESHIAQGLQRYLHTLKTIMESPLRPSAQDIARWKAEVDALPPEGLRESLAGLAADLRTAPDKILAGSEFREVLDGDYIASLSREEAAAEALKLRLRAALGLPVPREVAPPREQAESPGTQASGSQPSDDQLSEGQSSGDQPAGGQIAEPLGDQASGDQPSGPAETLTEKAASPEAVPDKITVPGETILPAQATPSQEKIPAGPLEIRATPETILPAQAVPAQETEDALKIRPASETILPVPAQTAPAQGEIPAGPLDIRPASETILPVPAQGTEKVPAGSLEIRPSPETNPFPPLELSPPLSISPTPAIPPEPGKTSNQGDTP